MKSRAYVTAAHLVGLVLFAASFPGAVQAAVVERELVIARESVRITGRPAEGMTINGSIPGPVLRFREGDTARLHVRNDMDVTTSIHWHGILLPPGMDGVPFISFPPIQPGTTFTYEFPIRQAGTYWYHSHTELQEQSGVYGAMVIEPAQKRFEPDRDEAVVLSDWTDEDPHAVLRTLRRGSHWYALEKGSAQSLAGAARLGMLGDFLSRELQRMPAMDIADVAYDRFLANGRPETHVEASAGDLVRLRIVDGSATTFFHLTWAGGPMTIVSADGQDVEPVEVDRLLVGVAETYDVLLRVPEEGRFELRATAHDASGYASVWVGGGGARHPAPAVPRPNLYHTMGGLTLKRVLALTPAGSMGMPDRDVEAGRFDRPGMAGMDHMDHGSMEGMDHEGMKPESQGMHHRASKAQEREAHMAGHAGPVTPSSSRGGKGYGRTFRPMAADVSSFDDLAEDGVDPQRPWPPYDKLRSPKPTAFAEDRPVRTIRLTLDGDMERYVWFLNEKPLSESDAIRIREGEVVRFIMINRTMMHHPMHLHGHFFRVVNRHGDHAPLKHTVDVAPMSTTVIEFDANEVGDWFFHCHLLYHMKSGMARVVEYEGFSPGPEVEAIRERIYKEELYAWGEIEALSNMTYGHLEVASTRFSITGDWEAGWQDVEGTEWEAIVKGEAFVNRFFQVFAGMDLEGVDDHLETRRGIGGIHYLLPFNFELMAWVDTDGGARFSVERHLQITPRLGVFGEAEYDTHEQWEERVGLSYTLAKDFSLVGHWHSDHGWGGGLQWRF